MPAPVRSPLPCKTMNFNGLLNNQLFPALCCLHHEQQCLHAKATKAKQTVASTRYLCTAAQHTVYCCTPHNPAYSNPYSECIKSTSPKDLTLLTAYMTETSTRSPPSSPATNRTQKTLIYLLIFCSRISSGSASPPSTGTRCPVLQPSSPSPFCANFTLRTVPP